MIADPTQEVIVQQETLAKETPRSDLYSVVCVVGENLIDLLDDGTGNVRVSVGGGPLNVARTIARLGGEVLFASKVSGDGFGRRIREDLVNDGIELAFSEPSPWKSTLALVDTLDGSPQYSFYLSETASFDLSLPELRSVVVQTDRSIAVLAVGSLVCAVEPIASVMRLLLEELPDGMVVAFDPNCRPGIVRDRALYLDSVKAILHRSHLFKVSREDLYYLAPGCDVGDALVVLGAPASTVVVVTDGPRPVQVIYQGSRDSVQVPSARVVDTVGAGDVLMGALLSRMVSSADPRAVLTNRELLLEAVHFAVAVSSLTCSRRGADPPTLAELTAQGV